MAFEMLERFGYALHPDLKVVERLSGNVRGPKRTTFGVPIQLQPLAGPAVSQQDVLAFVVPSPIHLLEVEDFVVELDPALQVPESNSHIPYPEVGHGSRRKRIDTRIHRAQPLP